MANKNENLSDNSLLLTSNYYNSPECFKFEMNNINDGDIINIKDLSNIRNIKILNLKLSALTFLKFYDNSFHKNFILINGLEAQIKKTNHITDLNSILNLGFTLQPIVGQNPT